MALAFDRVILIVLDSLGVGAAKDAHRFGDQNANTLKHIGEWTQKNKMSFSLPQLSKWGLGNLILTPGLEVISRPSACVGAMFELSPGKDTTTGHWEMAGNYLDYEFPVFEAGFSESLLQQWCSENKLPGYLGNKPASGTTILEELGEEHIHSGKPIVYTSGDSVFQVAAHEQTFGLEKLYEVCKSARTLLDPLGVGRVIARPFVGTNRTDFKRTENRRDYSVPPPQPNMLDILRERDFFVAGIGKIEDIFAHRSVNLVNHTGRNDTSLLATVDMMKKTSGQKGLIFTNLIDFDQLHGHRRDPATYAQALMEFDKFLPTIEQHCGPSDVVVLTADHGNDPTHHGTDHTREDVPLLIWSPNPEFNPQSLGNRLEGFGTVARFTLEALGLGSEVSRLNAAARAPSLLPFLDNTLADSNAH